MSMSPMRTPEERFRTQPHELLDPAGFYIVEDQAEVLAARIAAFAGSR